MKSVFVLIMLVSTMNVKADVICKKEGRNWYPENERAIKIAKVLGVKTCTGKRFKEVVAKLGEKTNVVTSAKKADSVEDAVKELSN